MPQALFDATKFCPLCGSDAYPLQMGQRRCNACGHQDFNNPIVAVAVFVLDPAENVLLIRRAKEPGKGKLAPPGGFVDAGESLETAARREIGEETGLLIHALTYLTSHPNNYNHRGLIRPVCDLFLMARVDSFEVELQLEEASDWVLMKPSEIEPGELAFDSMRHGLDALLHHLQLNN